MKNVENQSVSWQWIKRTGTGVRGTYSVRKLNYRPHNSKRKTLRDHR